MVEMPRVRRGTALTRSGRSDGGAPSRLGAPPASDRREDVRSLACVSTSGRRIGGPVVKEIGGFEREAFGARGVEKRALALGRDAAGIGPTIDGMN